MEKKAAVSSQKILLTKIWVPADSGIPLRGGPAIHGLSKPGSKERVVFSFRSRRLIYCLSDNVQDPVQACPLRPCTAPSPSVRSYGRGFR